MIYHSRDLNTNWSGVGQFSPQWDRDYNYREKFNDRGTKTPVTASFYTRLLNITENKHGLSSWNQHLTCGVQKG